MRNEGPYLCAGLAHPAFCLLPAAGCNAGFSTGANVEGRQMKTPDPTKAESSAPSKRKFTAAGSFPAKTSSVCAEVLARLLNSEHITGLQDVCNVNTNLMAAYIYCLEIAYGWTVERKKKVVVSKNGRMALVPEYWIDPKVIFLAKAAGADAWCTEVRAARSASRAKAADVRRLPDRANAARLSRSHVEQQSLFNKEMDASYGPV